MLNTQLRMAPPYEGGGWPKSRMKTISGKAKNEPLTVDSRPSRIGQMHHRLKVGVTSLSVSPKAIDEMRRAYDAKGDVEKARRHLQRAIEISPNFDEALNNLGTYYYRDGRFETAANLFQRALNANPNSFVAQVNLGGALVSLRDYERALVENFKALEMRPGDSLAEAQPGQAPFHLHRSQAAMHP